MVRCCPPLRGEAWNQAFRVSVAKNLRFVRFVRLGTGVSRAQSAAHSRYREILCLACVGCATPNRTGTAMIRR